MNKQEIFDTVVKGILSQGGASGTYYCKYRSENGRKCAAGWLIPDDIYSKNMENHDFRSLRNKFELIKRQFDDEETEFIKDMQSIHDNAAIVCDDTGFFKTWIPRMKMLGMNHQLNLKVFDECGD